MLKPSSKNPHGLYYYRIVQVSYTETIYTSVAISQSQSPHSHRTTGYTLYLMCCLSPAGGADQTDNNPPV